MFTQDNCSFSFASHLFSQEVKHLYSEETVPRGVSYRISPTSYLELPPSSYPVSTLSQSLQTSLSTLVRTVSHSVPHFIQCIRPSRSSSTTWDTSYVRDQVRQLQVTEMVTMRSGGLLFTRTREQWERKYRMLGECEEVMERIRDACDEVIVGRSEVFYSQKVKQLLGKMRKQKMEESAVIIQKRWRKYRINKFLIICLEDFQVQRFSDSIIINN